MKILRLEDREERVESLRIGTATFFVTLGWLPPPQGGEGGKHAKREREREGEKRRKAYFSGIHGKSGKTVVVSKRVSRVGEEGCSSDATVTRAVLSEGRW